MVRTGYWPHASEWRMSAEAVQVEMFANRMILAGHLDLALVSPSPL